MPAASIPPRSRVRRKKLRAGVIITESAIVLPVALLVIFSLLDLGLAAIRYNALGEAARLLSREAICRGSLASDVVDSWGPDEYEGTAADDSVFSRTIQRRLPTMESADVQIRIAWLDGANDPRDRVEVRLNYTHEPLLPGIMVWGPIELSSTSTLRIVN